MAAQPLGSVHVSHGAGCRATALVRLPGTNADRSSRDVQFAPFEVALAALPAHAGGVTAVAEVQPRLDAWLHLLAMLLRSVVGWQEHAADFSVDSRLFNASSVVPSHPPPPTMSVVLSIQNVPTGRRARPRRCLREPLPATACSVPALAGTHAREAHAMVWTRGKEPIQPTFGLTARRQL